VLFNSVKFLYLFLPVTYVVFWMLRTKAQRYVWLTVTGYVFYAFWNYKFCALMFFSTMVSYMAGLGLAVRRPNSVGRRIWLIVPITVDLTLLGVFKYTNFVIESTNHVAVWFGMPIELPLVDIVLPVGISFYTFHTITYIVDIYRGVIAPTRNFFEFSCYVSLFAQLVAGPIVRFRQIESDLDRIDRADRREGLAIGWSFFVIGMIKKVIVADSIAMVVDPALARYAELSSLAIWLCMLGYTYQLYFDFSGYSDMAVGLGHMFGLRLPQNFRSPYKATDISDFWRRWHISLSSCLRDYLYIPLGGGRGSAWHVNRNLMITMLLGGLWHGAHWTFVLWGAYHGLLLVLYRSVERPWSRLPIFVQRGATFLLVLVGWVFFRSDGLPMVKALLGGMFFWHGGESLGTDTIGVIALLVLATVITQFAPNTFELTHRWRPATSLVLVGLFAICLFLIYGAHPSPFLYFQF
jgi:alginate O-acetyltransferase complex protein AlgI